MTSARAFANDPTRNRNPDRNRHTSDLYDPSSRLLMRRMALQPVGVATVLTIAPKAMPCDSADHSPGLSPNNGHLYTTPSTTKKITARNVFPPHHSNRTKSTARYIVTVPTAPQKDPRVEPANVSPVRDDRPDEQEGRGYSQRLHQRSRIGSRGGGRISPGSTGSEFRIDSPRHRGRMPGRRDHRSSVPLSRVQARPANLGRPFCTIHPS